MSKLKDTDYTDVLELSPADFRKLQKKRGWALYLVGIIVYYVLILFGNKPQQYYNICPYFEIGKNWGGLAMGWFFVCSKNSDDGLKSHEVGHGVQNATIGGLRMLFLSIGSAMRYWKREVFGAKTAYDSWWFEGQATSVGATYVHKHKQ